MKYFLKNCVQEFCLLFTEKGSPATEKGSSLVEILVALSLFSIVTLSAGLLLIQCKSLEKKTLAEFLLLNVSLSSAEAGYHRKTPDKAAAVESYHNKVRADSLNQTSTSAYWRTRLQQEFPEVKF